MVNLLCRFGLHSKVPCGCDSMLVCHELVCRRCPSRWGVVAGRGFVGTVRLADAHRGRS